MANLRKNLRRLRLKRGLTQAKLAEEAGMDPKHLQRIEGKNVNAKRRWNGVRLETVERLARALGVDSCELVAPNDSDAK